MRQGPGEEEGWAMSAVAPGRPPAVPGRDLLRPGPGGRYDMMVGAEEVFAAHGDVVRALVGPSVLRRQIYFVFHPDGAHRVLASHAVNYRKDNVLYREVRRLYGDGLLTSQDDVWQRQRRFLQPLFTAQRVASYVATMADAAEQLVLQRHLRRVVGG